MPEMEVSTQTEARLRTAALRLKSALAAAEVMEAGTRVLVLLGKANFDPNQPRVPRGNSDGGQWTRVDGWHSSRARQQLAAAVALPRRIRRLIFKEPRPDIPKDKPERMSLRWPVVKEVAGWVARIGLQETPVGPVLDLIQAAQWIYEYGPYISAFLDGPKSLEELQSAVSEPKKGYDIHHIVEKTPALADGFSRLQTELPENLVRIPTLKHWRVTGWFAKPNATYGDLSPREYLRGKSWAERYRVGLDALIDAGVLQP